MSGLNISRSSSDLFFTDVLDDIEAAEKNVKNNETYWNGIQVNFMRRILDKEAMFLRKALFTFDEG